MRPIWLVVMVSLFVASACDAILDISPRSPLRVPDGAAGSDGGALPPPSVVADANTEQAPCGAPTVDAQHVVSSPGRGPVSWQPLPWAIYVVPAPNPAGEIAAVWGAKHVLDDQFGIFKSASPHEPPYDQELPLGLLGFGFASTGCLDARAVSPSGIVVFSTVLVPTDTAPTGASFEGRSDHVIVGPLHVEAEILSGDGTPSDELPTQTIPPAPMLYDYPLAFAGASVTGFKHVLLDWQEGFGAINPGAHTLLVSITDGDGVSTSQSVHFVVQ